MHHFPRGTRVAESQPFKLTSEGSSPSARTIYICPWCGDPVGKSRNGRQKRFCDSSCFGHWNNAQRSIVTRRAVASKGGRARGKLWQDPVWVERYFARFYASW